MQKIKQFLTRDIWRIRAKKIKGMKGMGLQHARIILLSLRGFAEDKCQLRASALTFYSLLSVVPIVAMAFGIAKGFGFDAMLQDQLRMKMQAQVEVIDYVIQFAQRFLENTKGGLIAGIGIALLFWTVIKVLGNIEHSFNDIWGVKTPRTLLRKFSDYLAIMLICPVLFIFSSSVTVFITSQVTRIAGKLAMLGPISGLLMFSLKFLPYTILWLLFSFMYIIMPNTRVKISSGIFAGIVAGTLYQLVQWGYVAFQIGAGKYGAIYGSFAALPLFLIWLQISWLVVLFGAEVSFAHQNVETYEFEPDCAQVTHAFKRLVTLRVMILLVQSFTKGQEPLTTDAIAHTLDLPVRLLRDVLFELVRARIVSEVKSYDPRISAYQPARDIDSLTISEVNRLLDHTGIADLPITPSPELDQLQDSLTKIEETIQRSPSNLLLKNVQCE